MRLPFEEELSPEERIRRIREFQQLPTDEKWRRIFEVMAAGLEYVRNSPQREEYERYFEEQEEEWRRVQRELFARHALVDNNPTDAQ
jgi:hypothetical protein